jgi:hypothetical protein
MGDNVATPSSNDTTTLAAFNLTPKKPVDLRPWKLAP